MKKLTILAALLGYTILAFVLEGQLEQLRKVATANFNTQLFFWGRSFADLLEAGGLLALTWFALKSEKSRLVAWVFIGVGIFLTFYTPLATVTPALPTRFMLAVSFVEFIGAYVALLGVVLLVAPKRSRL